MLERATGFEASVVEGRFIVPTQRGRSPWVVMSSLERLNALLANLVEAPLAEHEYKPVRAAWT